MSKSVKVILTKTVSNLGQSGDEVHVKAGYARNFLFPQASPSHGARAQASRLRPSSALAVPRPSLPAKMPWQQRTPLKVAL